MAKCIFLILLAGILDNGHCQGLLGLPKADLIPTLLLRYEDSLTFLYQNQILFPTLEFKFRGKIIGWTFAAVENSGGGRAILSTWYNNGGDRYVSRNDQLVDWCFSSTVTLSNGTEVIIHEGGPVEGIDFYDGDILGLFIRPQNIADYDIYLYNGNEQSEVDNTSNGYFSFSYSSRGPRFSDVRLSAATSAQLLPLISLELCTLDPLVTGYASCDNNTKIKSKEDCTIPTNQTATDVTSTPVTTSIVVVGVPQMFLILVSALPVVLFLFLLLVSALLVTTCCLSARKRRYTMYSPNSGTMEMHHMNSNGDVEGLGCLADGRPDYDVLNPSYVLPPSAGKVIPEGRVSPGNYEQPISHTEFLNGAAAVDNHAYDSPSMSRPTSAVPHSVSPCAHSPGVGVTMGPDLKFYHILDREDAPLSARSGGNASNDTTSPLSSPHRHSNRLRSNEMRVFRKVSASSNICPDSANSDRFFRLEAGEYVPTQYGEYRRCPRNPILKLISVWIDLKQKYSSSNGDDSCILVRVFLRILAHTYQQNQRSHLTIEPIFDDKSYAILKKGVSPSVNNWNFFEETEAYWIPASDSKTLYDQLSSQKYREISRKQLEINEHLGSGEFGTVSRGVWHTEQGDLDIAIKMLNSHTTERDKVRFFQEAAIIGQFKHPNIVRLHGVVTVEEQSRLIILELVPNGDLRTYLKSTRSSCQREPSQDLPQRLLSFCSDVALGMEYLSRKDFIHRDLAARNILLSEDFICKITDFGMSRDLADSDYYISNGGKIPIKWTAPEALLYRKYSSGTDVWSYGVLLYEIWSLGRTPYNEQNPEQTISMVNSGVRLAPPPGCPKAIYKTMIKCWNPDSHLRPTFSRLLHDLSRPMEEILQWSTENTDMHLQATMLGAPLEDGKNLYSDLQKSYLYASADWVGSDPDL